MDINPTTPPRDPLGAASPRDPARAASSPKAAQGADAAAAPSSPVTKPEVDGVFATFESSRPEQDPVDEKQTRERSAAAEQQRAELVEQANRRLPANSDLAFQVDPDTQETTVQIRDRSTGDVLREIPERELKDILLEGPTTSGGLVNRTF